MLAALARRGRLGARRLPDGLALRLLRPARRARRVRVRRPRAARHAGRPRVRARRGPAPALDRRRARGEARDRAAEALPDPRRLSARARRRPRPERLRDRGLDRPSRRAEPGGARGGARARARARAQPRRPRPDLGRACSRSLLVDFSRIGGWFERALLAVLGPVAAAFVHLLLSPKRELAADRVAAGSVRLGGRARRRAASGSTAPATSSRSRRARRPSRSTRSTRSPRRAWRRCSSRIRRSSAGWRRYAGVAG